MIRKWGITDTQAQKRCIEEILTRIEEQSDADFGMIAAQDLIDIVAKYVGPAAYNSALDDAKKSLQAKVADLEIELDILKSTR